MRSSAAAILDRSAALTLSAEGRPERLEWNARVFLVTDAPTPLETTLGLVLTHPLPVQGWRVPGTAGRRGGGGGVGGVPARGGGGGGEEGPPPPPPGRPP